MDTNNRIALVTGGSRGLGKNAALQLAQRGIDVIVTYRSKKEEAEAVAAQISQSGRKALAIPLDTAVIASFDGFMQLVSVQLQEKWGRTTFDFLINNAGIEANSLIEQTDEEMFDSLCNVHFKGVYFLTQKAIPLLADNGRIINISTGLTRFTKPGYAAYASMKGAVEIFTKYLARELGHRGISANLVAPGITKTDFTKGTFESHPQMEEMVASQIALGRVGVPDDIGSVIAFLCTEDARWINAQRIEASGGMLL